MLWIVACAVTPPLSAGEFFVGLRTWSANWSPGVIKKQRKDADAANLENVVTQTRAIELVPYAADDVAGLYTGPLLSYVTDDRKWSFSVVGMTGRSGLQGYTNFSVEEEVTDDDAVILSRQVNVATRPKRYDADFTAAYAIGAGFKVFAGWKYQAYRYDVDTGAQGIFAGEIVDEGETFSFRDSAFGIGSVSIRHRYSGPAVGLAYSVPLSDRGALALSVGYFTASGTSKESERLSESNGAVAGQNVDVLSLSSLNTTIALRGVTVEATVTVVVTADWFLQFSYRYQNSRMDSQFTWASDSVSVTRFGSEVELEAVREPYDGDKFRDRFSGFSLSILRRIQ